jgi:hypothetical protein
LPVAIAKRGATGYIPFKTTTGATEEVLMDFVFEGDFSATEVLVTPTSDAGRAVFAEMFGAGAVSATLLKSAAMRFADRVLEQHGLRCA